MTLAAAWPPAQVRVETPRLELRLPTENELVELARVALEGIHDETRMPFASPWTDAPAEQIASNLLKWHWGCRARWLPSTWTLLLVAFVDGVPVGAQDIGAIDYAIRREVGTGSWLARARQGQGLGREMRDAVLHLAFDGLDALEATSGAYDDNTASLAVSRGAGYVPDGTRTVVRSRGECAPDGPSSERVTEQRFRLQRDRWQSSKRSDIRIHGLDDERIRSWFGCPSR